jgi:hypothetical protein
MLFIIGVILLVVAVAMTFIYIRHSRRPKAEATVESVFYKRLKSDKTNELGERKHGNISYRVGAQTYQVEILVFEKTKAGEQIMITYKENDPAVARLSNPGRELIAVIGCYIVGLLCIGISILVMDRMN